MKWLLLLLLLAVSASAYTISDYPNFFVQNGRFNAIYVIGEEAPALDVVSATAISTALAKYPDVTTEVGTSRLDIEISDITKKNAIVVGSPCENRAAYALEGNPDPCFRNLGGSSGYIKLFENNGKVQLLITGLTAQDRHAAAKFLAERSLTNIKLTTYVIPTNTGSTPSFYEQKNKIPKKTSDTTIIETPIPQITAQNITPSVEKKEIAPVPDKKSGTYEPLRELPKPQGFWSRLWSWFKGLFS